MKSCTGEKYLQVLPFIYTCKRIVDEANRATEDGKLAWQMKKSIQNRGKKCDKLALQ